MKTIFRIPNRILILASSLAMSPALIAATGAEVYGSGCIACHATGVLGAPKVGDTAAWTARKGKGLAVLVENASKGINAMPPKGGNPALSETEMHAAIEFMLAQSGVGEGQSATQAATDKKPDPVPAEAAKTAAPQTNASAASATRPANVQVVAAAVPAPTVKRAKPVNSFNRLLKPPSQRNLPPLKDGIHDPGNDGTGTLQHPKEAFDSLPKANSGNRVDWVAALDKGDVQPRFDLEDENRKPVVLDLNIVREVKGSMPDVVYPHKQHTEWLDCSNCHPAIFVPKKGANNISMASILLGEKCGVCHGKVAFPVSECRKCHSKNKDRTASK